MAQPNSAGTITTTYASNKTTVTSPTGKWKRQEMDAAGNLIRVAEPAPSPYTGEWFTDYTYNDRNQLLTVTMTRPTGAQNVTQTRTFTYSLAGQVLTASNPENGTVTNTYSSTTGLLTQKLDAKGNKVTYVYL